MEQQLRDSSYVVHNVWIVPVQCRATGVLTTVNIFWVINPPADLLSSMLEGNI